MSTYAERVESGQCAQCDEPAAPDSDRCETHRQLANAAKRKWAAKHRAANRASGMCAECSTPSLAYYCTIHAIKMGRAPRAAVDAAVDKQSRIDSRTKTDTTGRRRYHGRTRSDPQRDNLVDAIRLLERARNGLALASTVNGTQRRAAVHAALAHADRAARIIAELCARHGYEQQALVPG